MIIDVAVLCVIILLLPDEIVERAVDNLWRLGYIVEFTQFALILTISAGMLFVVLR